MSSSKEVADLMKDTANTDVLIGMTEVTDWSSTGCNILDLAISGRLPGGAPVGRVVQFFGAASTAKSVITETILGYALRSNKQAFLCDVEYTFDPKFASIYGLDSRHEDFFWGYDFMPKDKKPATDQPESIEEFFDVYLRGILDKRSRRPKIVVLDTLTALPSKSELKGVIEEGGYKTTRAKAISEGLRKYLAEMNQRDVSLICVDQTRDNIGGFGAAEVTNGGRGMEFYASTRIHLKKGPKVKNPNDKVTGVWVKFEVIKNKVSPPFRDGQFRIMFDYGMDNISSNLVWLASNYTDKDDLYKKTLQIPLISCPTCHKLYALPDRPKIAIAAAKAVGTGDKKEKQKNLEELLKLTEGMECNEKHDKPVQLKIVSKRIMDWVPFIEEHNLEGSLDQVVATKWAGVYAPEKRKERKW
jgi:protein RecA